MRTPVRALCIFMTAQSKWVRVNQIINTLSKYFANVMSTVMYSKLPNIVCVIFHLYIVHCPAADGQRHYALSLYLSLAAFSSLAHCTWHVISHHREEIASEHISLSCPHMQNYTIHNIFFDRNFSLFSLQQFPTGINKVPRLSFSLL